MAKPLLSDELWEQIKPHIPPEPPKPKGGRPRIPDRACLTGILFVLKTGTPWEYLPRENGLRQRYDLLATPARLADCRRMAENMARIIEQVGHCRYHRLVRCGHGQLFCPSTFWGAKTGPNPTDRGKNGSKRHLIVDGRGIPLAIEHTGANVHDSEMAIPLVEGIPPIKQSRGRPRKRPDNVFADRAYDAEEKIRQPLRQHNVTPQIAKRNTEHGSGLGKFRYVV